MALDRLRKLRDETSGEIPEKIIHFGNFKVRRNWFNGIIGSLGRLKKKNLIPENLTDEVDDFIKKYTSTGFKTKPLTTTEDIQNADDLISKILGDQNE